MIAVVGGKGGTGKTTSSLGLAQALATRRRRPIVVDADVDMPDLAVICEVPTRPGLDALGAGTPLTEVTHPAPALDGVSVIPADPGASLDAALPELPRGRAVILDCGPGAAADVARPLRRADGAILVTRPNRTAVGDACKTAAMATRLDTPVLAVLAIGAQAVPDRLRDRIDAGVGIAVPTAPGPPLRDEGVNAAYRRLAAEIEGYGLHSRSGKR